MTKEKKLKYDLNDIPEIAEQDLNAIYEAIEGEIYRYCQDNGIDIDTINYSTSVNVEVDLKYDKKEKKGRTIIEMLGGIRDDIGNAGRTKDVSMLPITVSQVISAIALLEKGYDGFTDINQVINTYGSIDDAPYVKSAFEEKEDE